MLLCRAPSNYYYAAHKYMHDHHPCNIQSYLSRSHNSDICELGVEVPFHDTKLRYIPVCCCIATCACIFEGIVLLS